MTQMTPPPTSYTPTINHDDLLAFIERVEKSMFRTHTDVGANLNALIVWNELRNFAGLTDLDRLDLVQRHADTLWADADHYIAAGQLDAAKKVIKVADELDQILEADNPWAALNDWDARIAELTRRING